MPDPNDTTAPPPAALAPQPSPTIDAPPVPAYTQMQVDAMIADASRKAHDAANADARRRYEGKQPAGASAPATQPTQTPIAQAAATGMTPQDFLRISAFTAVAAEVGIPARGVEMLLERVMSEKPQDVRAWTTTEAASFGWSKSTPSTPTAPGLPAATPSATAQQPVPPIPTPSGSPPAPSAAGSYDLKPTQMKQADVSAYITKHGYRAFAALVRSEMAGTRVAAPPRR